MAKIDTQLEQIELGFQNPEIRFGTMWIPDSEMATHGLRRKDAKQAQHRVCYLSIGETGQAPTATFWGHKFTDCLIQALEWRQLPTKSKRGPRKKAEAAVSAIAG